MRSRTKEGSISIEAALILPICILVIIFFAKLLSAFQLEMNLRAAMDATAKEASLALATAGLWEELPQTAVNFVSNSFELELPSALNEWILELTASELASPFVMNRIYTFHEQDYLYPSLSADLLNDPALRLQRSESDTVLWMDLFYNIQFMGLTVPRQIRQPIILWHALPSIDDEHEGIPEDIWSMDNFSRGEFFQQYYGANLPQKYPVFSRYENGHATSIMSVDITAPTYEQLRNLSSLIRAELDTIAAYDDPGPVWRRNPISFMGSDIRSRSLVLVFPTNDRNEALQVVEELRPYAQSLGVNLKLRRAGLSERYSDQD